MHLLADSLTVDSGLGLVLLILAILLIICCIVWLVRR